VPDFEVIAGVSLSGAARLRFRPYPWRPERKKDVFALELAPRSAYLLRDQARWNWQHSVPPVKVLRYSITFRTQRSRNCQVAAALENRMTRPLRNAFLRTQASDAVRPRPGAAMDPRFKAQYVELGRSLQFMGFSVEDMEPDELYAIIGFLLEKVGDDWEALLRQEAPLGAPLSDPPKNDGLVEG
jgi:hypothetical protein